MPALVGQWKLPVKSEVLVIAQFINLVPPLPSPPPPPAWLQSPFNEYAFTHADL